MDYLIIFDGGICRFSLSFILSLGSWLTSLLFFYGGLHFFLGFNSWIFSLGLFCLGCLCLFLFSLSLLLFWSFVLHICTQVIFHIGIFGLCRWCTCCRTFLCRILILVLFLFSFNRGLRSRVFKSFFGDLFLQTFRNLIYEGLLLINCRSLAALVDLIVSDHDDWLDIVCDICIGSIWLGLFAYFEMREFNSRIFRTTLIFPVAGVLPFRIFIAPLDGNFSGNITRLLLDRLIRVEVDL